MKTKTRRVGAGVVAALLAALLMAAAGTLPASGQAEAALAGVAQLSAGEEHTCALLTSGQVRCWGDNASGQLGDGNLGNDSDRPVPVRNVANTGNLTGVTQISSGLDHTCARLGTGRAVCWGEDGSSQLGDNSGIDSDTPVEVRNANNTAALTGVVAVSGGGDHSCALVTGGQARCWGDNTAGEIGDGTNTDRFTARAVRNATNTANLTGVAEIDAGEDFTCARLITGGQVRCWGESGSGRLGNNDIATDRNLPVTVLGPSTAALAGATQLAVGGDHVCARLSSAKAVCWGDNAIGELGDGTGSDSLRPGFVASVTGDGDLTGVAQVSAPIDDSTCARVSGGQVRCWGDNTDGQSGTGAVGNTDLPVVMRNVIDSGPVKNVAEVSAGDEHTCVRLTNGQVRCVGDDSQGQLGNGGLTVDSLLLVVVRAS